MSMSVHDDFLPANMAECRPLLGQYADSEVLHGDYRDDDRFQTNEGRIFLEDGGDEPGSFDKDPFQPFDDLPCERRDILTLRAIVVGLF